MSKDGDAQMVLFTAFDCVESVSSPRRSVCASIPTDCCSDTKLMGKTFVNVRILLGHKSSAKKGRQLTSRILSVWAGIWLSTRLAVDRYFTLFCLLRQNTTSLPRYRLSRKALKRRVMPGQAKRTRLSDAKSCWNTPARVF